MQTAPSSNSQISATPQHETITGVVERLTYHSKESGYTVVRLYLRRFTVDHWYRSLNQRLHWTLPKLSTPKHCERWSDLMPNHS